MAAVRPIISTMLAAAAMLCSLAWSGSSHASDTFPAKMQETLDMPCAPQCTVCHLTNEGGFGTIKGDSFGEVAYGLGLRATDDGCIPTLLAALERGATGDACGGSLQEPDGSGAGIIDTDADGAPDVAELRAGEDPNVVGGEGLCVVRYGCGARIAPQHGGAGLGAAGAALVLLGLVLARARKR
jgi:hypothetical protein